MFSLDGRTLYTVSDDGTAVAWDVEGSRSLKRSFTFTHDRDFDRRGTATRGGSAPTAG